MVCIGKVPLGTRTWPESLPPRLLQHWMTLSKLPSFYGLPIEILTHFVILEREDSEPWGYLLYRPFWVAFVLFLIVQQLEKD